MKLFRQGSRGFSLFEVMIAVGIFGAAITIMLSLLPALVASAAKTSDTVVAVRLPDAVGLELQRVAL
ncbi:MAG: prepilin-type N-terminal cleavage/methylation domain-containing protein [Lacunisphaera sp.]|nr:prepilin-type N-terminal cleavage/methylation domain-containing protein [Lacunisphaera sp.]